MDHEPERRDLDALIERAVRGEAGDADGAWLAEWRRGSPEHERRFRAVERLAKAARSLDAGAPAARRPAASEIIARADERAARPAAPPEDTPGAPDLRRE